MCTYTEEELDGQVIVYPKRKKPFPAKPAFPIPMSVDTNLITATPSSLAQITAANLEIPDQLNDQVSESRLSSINDDQEAANDEGKEEPYLPPRLRKRAERALNDVIVSIDSDEYCGREDERKNKCFEFCNKTCCHGPLEVSPMSPSLSIALPRSTRMTKQMMFPILPKLVRDVWVFLELGLTLFQLIFSLVNIQFTTNRVYNILYIFLASLNTLMACIDAFTYYYQLGSCKTCYDKMRRETQVESEICEASDAIQRLNCKTKYLKFLKTWIEVLRIILSELMLYPLVILDLFELLGSKTFNGSDQNQIITFFLFIFGSLYFVLNVYVVRLVMLMTTIITFKKIASLTTGNIDILIRFLFHVIGQIIVHLLCIIAVGMKINQENSIPHEGDYRVTPFLLVAILSGWIVPLMGTIAFFIVNYYWLEMFSIGVFIDMMSLLEGQSFGQAVIRSRKKILKDVHEKTDEILKKVEFAKIKREYRERDEVNWFVKLLYPLKVPIFAIYALFYNGLLMMFCVSLVLTIDSNGNVTAAVTNSDNTSTAILLIIALLFTANLHLVLIINLWPFLCVLFVVLILLSTSVVFATGPLMCILALVYYIARKEGRYKLPN